MQARPTSGSSRNTLVLVAVAVTALFVSTSCGGGGSTASNLSSSNSPLSHSIASHVAIVVLENENYKSVVNSAAMPYLNSLIAQGALATNYFANAHPSLPNYFMLTVGNTVTTTDSFDQVVPDDSVVREVTNAGMTWKAYAQSLPSAGYLGPDVYPYYRHHVPFVFFSDVVQNTTQQLNIVPQTQLTTDMANGALPNYFMLIPDQENNAHDCPTGGYTGCTNAAKMAAADAWLKTNVGLLLANPEFQQSGLLIITFDESGGDLTNGGGKVATVLVGAHVRPGYQGSLLYQHQSLLKLTMQALGIHTYPGAAGVAPDMSEFFQ